MDGLVGHRLCCDVNFLTLLNLRQLLLIDIGLDPDLAEIGNSKQRVACVDVLPLCHLAIDDRPRGICVDGHVRDAIFSGRFNLFRGNTPKLQLVLACLHQRIGLRARKRIVRLLEPFAVFLGQAIFLNGGCNFRTVDFRHRLAAAHTLSRVLHIQFVHASTDARAHRRKLSLRLLHASKRVNVRLEQCRANLGNLHSGRCNLGRAQFHGCAGLRTLRGG